MNLNRIRTARSWFAAYWVAAMLVASGCAIAQTGGSRGMIPPELIGVWDIAASGCTGQGNPDSDTRLVITRTGIDNYQKTGVRVHFPLPRKIYPDPSFLTERYIARGLIFQSKKGSDSFPRVGSGPAAWS